MPFAGEIRLRYRLKAAAAALYIAFLTGCPPTTGPTEELEADFEWGINRLQTEPAFVVNSGTGEITLRGYFETPCTPFSAIARAEVTDNHITLTVYARQPEGCRQVLGTVGYQAIIRGVPAGTYALFVSHTYPISSATVGVMMEPQVVVH